MSKLKTVIKNIEKLSKTVHKCKIAQKVKIVKQIKNLSWLHEITNWLIITVNLYSRIPVDFAWNQSNESTQDSPKIQTPSWELITSKVQIQSQRAGIWEIKCVKQPGTSPLPLTQRESERIHKKGLQFESNQKSLNTLEILKEFEMMVGAGGGGMGNLLEMRVAWPARRVHFCTGLRRLDVD